MPKFYITYQNRYRNLRDCYSAIEAKTFDEAREIAANMRGKNIRGVDYAFMYAEHQKAEAIDKYGLTEVNIMTPGVEG